MNGTDVLPPDDERPKVVRRLRKEKFSRYFILTIVIGFLIFFANLISVFLLPIVLSSVITTLFYPMFRFVLKIAGYRRALSSILCCLILLIGLLIPLALLTHLVTREAVSFYPSSEQKIREWVELGPGGPIGKLKESRWVKRLYLDQLDWQQTTSDVLKGTGTLIATLIRKTSGGALLIVANVFVTLFICFYFFRDGESIVRTIRSLLPMPERYVDALITRFTAVSRATIKGAAVIGLTQSSLGAITLWIFGVESPLLWFFIMLLLSFVPVIGAWMVMHPAAIIQVLLGNIWQGVGIFLVTVLLISSIDNVLRPRLVGQFSGIHDLIIFFSALGGIRVFGPAGVIVGPVVAAFFVTIIEIYSEEFRPQLQT